jgi:hypothetical protein
VLIKFIKKNINLLAPQKMSPMISDWAEKNFYSDCDFKNLMEDQKNYTGSNFFKRFIRKTVLDISEFFLLVHFLE